MRAAGEGTAANGVSERVLEPERRPPSRDITSVLTGPSKLPATQTGFGRSSEHGFQPYPSV